MPSRDANAPELCQRPRSGFLLLPPRDPEDRHRFSDKTTRKEEGAERERRIQPMSAQRRPAYAIGANHLPRGSALL
jgi:hypothetical protein